MSEPQYFAHTSDSQDTGQWQSLPSHLLNVAELSGNFASKFGAREWGYLAGLLHDIGKYSSAFQKRLRDPTVAVDHSTAGAQYLVNHWGKDPFAKILAYVIAGHHSGLPDYGSLADGPSLAGRLAKPLEDYSAVTQDINPPERPTNPPLTKLGDGSVLGLQFSLLVRMLFSCLVDADSLDTESFVSPGQANLRESSTLNTIAEEMCNRFNNHICASFPSPDTRIKKLRAELLSEGLEQATACRQIFSLTLPTGSGKTLLSLGFSLNHARLHGMERIIYVIPFTSIIEQNAAIVRNVVGDEFVLEHHSSVAVESGEHDEEDFSLRRKLALAGDNWDAPIIMTTNVQFFESLFSHKRSRCRKLHRYANSVIVLDEAQATFGPFFHPSVQALAELVRNYGCSVVLCTATQPCVDLVLKDNFPVTPIIRDSARYFSEFERVKVSRRGITTVSELAEELAGQHQSLSIVNTRSRAQELFLEICQLWEDGVFHLSTRMCGVHRQQAFHQIRNRLNDGKRCIVVSTSLIEAGVDIDFPVVYRELCGLDSMAQSAGRCNREGRLESMGTLHMFELEGSKLRGQIRTNVDVARGVLQRFENPLSLEAMDSYFTELAFYLDSGEDSRLDKLQIVRRLRKGVPAMNFDFRTVGESFRLIDDETVSIIVSPDSLRFLPPEELSIVERAYSSVHFDGVNAKTLRALQSVTIQVFKHQFTKMKHDGMAREIAENLWALVDEGGAYDERMGLNLTRISSMQEETLII